MTELYKKEIENIEDVDAIETIRHHKDQLTNEYLGIDNGIARLDDLVEIRDGCMGIIVADVSFSCFFKSGMEKKLDVFLSSGHGGDKRIPIFHRHKYYNLCNSNVLCIDDPIYKNDSTRTNGWFIGTDDKDYCEYVGLIVKKISKTLNVLHKQITIWGSSSGGTAAISVSSKIRGSVSVSINPQIMPMHSKWTVSFASQFGHEMDYFKNRTDTKYLINRKKSPSLLICNIADKDDVRQILELYNVPLKLGLQRLTQTQYLWLYDAYGIPGESISHGNQETYSIFKVIYELVEDIRNGVNICFEKYELITDFWHEIYTHSSNSVLNYLKKELKSNDVVLQTNAFELLKKSSNGNPDALMLLADCYSKGIGTKKDVNQCLGILLEVRNVRPEAYNMFKDVVQGANVALQKKTFDALRDYCEMTNDNALKADMAFLYC